MTPDALTEVISAALTRVPEIEGITAEVRVDRPKNRDHGDYSTNIAMVLAKRAGLAPRDLAAKVVEQLRGQAGIEAVEIAGPGFINITLAADSAGAIAHSIVEQGADYGTIDALQGTALNLEFISANPTGPLHLGHTRWAAVGDAMARVLAAAGAEVTREFYVNDRGVQMDKFGQSLEASARGVQVPDGGYQGDYIHDLARTIVQDDPAILELPEDRRWVAFREAGYALQLQQQKDVLDNFRTHFDVWYSERSLHESGAVDRGMQKLREEGHVFEQDGAVWLRTTDFDDDKDRVLIKADGELTYFASDTAYYVNKRDRGFDVCVYLLGADHHGYVNRLRAVAACAGDDPDYNIEILIGQLVKMFKGGQEVRLSKRAGAMVTLEDLVDEVGVDAARYTLIRYPADSPLTMDLDLLVQRTNDNPVYYVQYAHARISSVLRNAADLGIDWRTAEFDPGLLEHERESALLGVLAEFPRIIATAAELREPHRVARYLEEVATAYHKFYDSCRVLPRNDEELAPLHIARLWLCAASRQVVANGLDLCGVQAPERM
ncbi:MAG: arginine--tRNA ligase [Actinobacteria bacterium]|jgi:arginyl-tRNA synthetase|nr:arginine--tRNA ligase [Actinomycetota bacterium]MCO5299031.1 arginine--tRNA ligase [Candidatus Nanopelagicales bacterium]MCB9427202.1 arginine--tRNA ligase [Actinomycetota bacterium]HPE11534.1 arginine--tRNA ligase [Actinomycetota bacterium]HPJ18670.1 arginine--tRNA ligase [Actinomycetota bacterium]